MTNQKRLAEAGGEVRLRRRGVPLTLIVGTCLFGVIVILAVLSHLVWQASANDFTDTTNRAPSAAHWLGTDEFGRDILLRSFSATSLSLELSLASTVGIIVIGVMLGAGIWFLPRRVREVALRLLEVSLSYPELLVAIFLAAILGTGSWQLATAVTLANIPSMARLASNLVAGLVRRDYLVTARALGVPPTRLITRHLIPNMAEPLLIQSASTFSLTLVSMSALSFVGLGVQTPAYDLGSTLSDALPNIYTQANEVIGPALMLVLLSFAAMLIGDGLAGIADPRAVWRRQRAKERRSQRATRAAGTTCALERLVRVEQLRVRADDGTEIVHGVTFGIDEGEIVGLVGESGSGKSLTAMALTDLLPAGVSRSADALHVAGIDMLGRPAPRALAKSVGLIYQDPSATFNPAWHMGTQLTEVLRTHGRLRRRQASDLIRTTLESMHIADPERLLGSYPHELSGGMRQRAMLAAALAAEPALLVLDEPTTALDVTVQASILRELKRISFEGRVAMLFISHDLSVVQALCDRVIVMQAGEVVETLTAADLKVGRARHPYTRMLLESVPAVRTTTREVAT